MLPPVLYLPIGRTLHVLAGIASPLSKAAIPVPHGCGITMSRKRIVDLLAAEERC